MPTDPATAIVSTRLPFAVRNTIGLGALVTFYDNVITIIVLPTAAGITGSRTHDQGQAENEAGCHP